MIPDIPLLEDYGLSPEFGFLPTELPLEILPDPYYNQWEAIVANLQALLLSKRLRGVVDKLPALSTSKLKHPAEWRRAYVLLSFLTHSYVWGGDRPEEVSLIFWNYRRCLTHSVESTTFHLDTISSNLRIS